MTLADLSAVTGISTSTLSRLESGRRKLTLELLMAIAGALDTTLDALVHPPAPADPRVVRPPVVVDGTTIIPLSGADKGTQAFHHTIPAPDERTPDPRIHDGYEWIYVLKGRLRLVLGATELVLDKGEAVEFDTRTPHWVGNGGRSVVQFLSIFGPQGERIHVRS